MDLIAAAAFGQAFRSKEFQDKCLTSSSTRGNLGYLNNMNLHGGNISPEIWLWTDGRKDGRTDGQSQNNIPPPMAGDNKCRTDGQPDNAKTISLRLWQGIIIAETGIFKLFT
ncbi:hypothetical protein DPMN_097555 [Dreissena polymorpha]|uniref:Uncharacterized protein n=1 Tax=Dreissena polymorpha TaxID=45954 RepID=A0A9D4LBG0_DREPO|nr:hypothetical protein DPMN_097555 [Dreissena polymorpha]